MVTNCAQGNSPFAGVMYIKDLEGDGVYGVFKRGEKLRDPPFHKKKEYGGKRGRNFWGTTRGPAPICKSPKGDQRIKGNHRLSILEAIIGNWVKHTSEKRRS